MSLTYSAALADLAWDWNALVSKPLAFARLIPIAEQSSRNTGPKSHAIENALWRRAKIRDDLTEILVKMKNAA
jgi:hypothetical protein